MRTDIINKDSDAAVCEINCPDYNPTTQCALSQQYVDGSSLQGFLFRDHMALSESGAGTAYNDFGCITSQSEHFTTDNTINGIWGVGKSIDMDGTYL